MDDLFSDLSSISDCDDDCLLNINAKKCKCFFIQTTLPEVVMEIPPAYELEVQTSVKQKTLEEKTTETDVKGEEKFCDKWMQTDDIEMESASCFADLPPTFREPSYSESALERVLRHISAHLHRAQLQQWLAEQPARNASFHIKPVQTKTIWRAVYNRERNVFVLLLQLQNQNPLAHRYFIELRSLKNLLKSINFEVPSNTFDLEKVRLFSSHHFIALYTTSKVFVLGVERLEKNNVFDALDLVSLLVLREILCYIDSSGVVKKLENGEKLLECSPLLNPIIGGFMIGTRIHVVSGKSISSLTPESPLDYESYETEKSITKGEIRRFGSNRLMLFDRESQTCFIWDTAKPKNPSHLLCFGPSEFTVDVAADDDNLYSLTSSGVVSVWKLRPAGRKYRDRLFSTYLKQCCKLLIAFPQKFVIVTQTEVHFVVFGTDSDGQ